MSEHIHVWAVEGCYCGAIRCQHFAWDNEGRMFQCPAPGNRRGYEIRCEQHSPAPWEGYAGIYS